MVSSSMIWRNIISVYDVVQVAKNRPPVPNIPLPPEFKDAKQKVDLFDTFNESDYELFIAPYIANISFATELFLKCLLTLENPSIELGQLKKKARISRFIRCSSSDSKIAIEQFYINTFEKHPSLLNKTPDLRIALEDSNFAFQEWRYIFEKNRASPRNLESFELARISDSVRHRIVRLKPDWFKND